MHWQCEQNIEVFSEVVSNLACKCTGSMNTHQVIHRSCVLAIMYTHVLTECANQGVHRHDKSANMYMHWQREQTSTC